MTSDYPAFFYAFSIFDRVCIGTEIDKQKFIADKVAKETHKLLSESVTMKKLVRYMKSLNIQNYKYQSVQLLIDFVVGTYFSENITDVIRYALYDKFSEEILLINAWLMLYMISAKKVNNNLIKFKEPLAVYASVRRMLSKHSIVIHDEISEYFKDLHKQVKFMPKTPAAYSNKTRRSVREAANRIYEDMKNIRNIDDEQIDGIADKMFSEYEQLAFEIEGEKVGFFTLVQKELFKEEKEEAFKTYFEVNKNGNIYVQLIFSTSNKIKTDVKSSIDAGHLYVEVLNEINEYISSVMETSTDNHYNKTVEFVSLHELKIPILTYIKPTKEYQLFMSDFAETFCKYI